MEDTTELSSIYGIISIIFYSGIIYLYGFYHGYYHKNENILKKYN